jgi:hypothetical protein
MLLRLPLERLRTYDTGKALLRSAMVGRLPDSIRLRPKLKSFDKHIEKGLGIQGAAKVRRLFRRPRLAELGLVDGPAFLQAYEDYCRRVVGSTGTGPPVGSMAVWRTISAELWLRVVT